MDKFGAAFRRVTKFLDRQRVDAPATPVSCLEDGHPAAGARELAGGHQTRSAATDYHKMLLMLGGHGLPIAPSSAGSVSIVSPTGTAPHGPGDDSK
jgi:hypothetical protein